MFEVYAEEFELETRSGKQKIKLLPLNGRYYKKFIKALTLLVPEDAKPGDVDNVDISSLSPEGLELVHELVLASLVKSYPDKKEEDLDMFVTQNLFKFIQPFIKVNMGSDESQ